MEKIIFLVFSAVLLVANENPLVKCNECHNNFLAPPYKKIYKHYLVKYSSKQRIKNAMIEFLKAPSKEKSSMSNGLKRRFNPSEHPRFNEEVISKSVTYIIKQEDVIKRIKLN